MSMGPAGMGQSGGHAPSNLNDNMAPGLPPTSMMQSQMSNGEILHIPLPSMIIIFHTNPDLVCTHTAPSCCPSPVLCARLIPNLLHVCLQRQYHFLSVTVSLVFISCKYLMMLCSADGLIVRFDCRYFSFFLFHTHH